MIWRKIFKDGTKESSSEDNASWSRGRLEDMVAAQVSMTGQTALIHIPEGTEWHQFDRMVVPIKTGTHEPRQVATILQAKIKIEHTDGYIVENIHSKHHRKYIFKEEKPENLSAGQKVYPIKHKHFDKWFTVAIMEDGSGWAENKYIVSFTDKGKLN